MIRRSGAIRERGYAMLSVVVVTGVLLTAGVAVLQLARTELHSTADQAAKQRAFYIAERGLQHGLAKLDQDRSGSIATTYSTSLTNQSFGEGTYSVAVTQDTVYPTDATRKLITSTGTFANQSSTVTAHAVVQDVSGTIGGGSPNPLICFTNLGTCTIAMGVDLASGIFNGTLVSNNNVALNNNTPLGLLLHATGDVYAKNSFASGGANILSLGAVLSTVTGRLYSGVAYTPPTFLGIQKGFKFSLGNTVQAMAARPFLHPDYEAIKKDSRTVLVRQGQVPAGTSWNSGTNTWNAGSFGTTADTDKIYYVEGNALLTGLQLAKGLKITIVARGTITVNSLTLLSAGLIAGSNQALRLIGENDVTLGGIDMSLIALATTNYVFTYSEKGSVTLNMSAISSFVQTNLSMMAWNNATLTTLASVGNTINTYWNQTF
jgi:Tfp pilus assembly protein PilX